MGAEAVVDATFESGDGTVRAGAAKALLETDFLRVAAPLRATVRFDQLRSVEVEAEVLTLTTLAGDRLRLALGARTAERWAQRIRNPPSLLDKLGVRPVSAVAVLGIADGDVLEAIGARVPGFITIAEPSACPQGTDILLAGISRLGEIATLAPAVPRLAATGALWIVFPKGPTGIRDSDVLPAGKQLGLVDNKVARVSDTHTALRFVVPKAAREGWPRGRAGGQEAR